MYQNKLPQLIKKKKYTYTHIDSPTYVDNIEIERALNIRAILLVS